MKPINEIIFHESGIKLKPITLPEFTILFGSEIEIKFVIFDTQINYLKANERNILMN